MTKKLRYPSKNEAETPSADSQTRENTAIPKIGLDERMPMAILRSEATLPPQPPSTAEWPRREGKTIQRKNAQPKPLRDANRGQAEQAALNRKKAFELRAKRQTYQQIGDTLGVSGKTAWGYVEEHWRELKELTKEEAEMLRHIELQTLDQMEARWAPLATAAELDVQKLMKGKDGPVVIHLQAYDAGLKAVDRVLKIQERRARLLGLDMPEKIEHSGPKHMHLTLDEFRERLRDAKAGEAKGICERVE